jgi:hypothetical protein
MTMTRGRTLSQMVAFADKHAPDGVDGHPGDVNLFSGPNGDGFCVEWDDETSGVNISTRFLGGNTETGVALHGGKLDSSQLARVSAAIGIAARFAVDLERYATTDDSGTI